MCSYTRKLKFPKTSGGLILLKPESSGPLQYAATASFLAKLYSDYLELMHSTSSNCGSAAFSIQTLTSFSWSQVKNRGYHTFKTLEARIYIYIYIYITKVFKMLSLNMQKNVYKSKKIMFIKNFYKC